MLSSIFIQNSKNIASKSIALFNINMYMCIDMYKCNFGNED